MSRSQLIWGQKQVISFLTKEFPQAFANQQQYDVIELAPQKVSIKLDAGQNQLRPGGTVSGPAQMELADFSMYFLLLAHHGDAATLCVTTNLSCSFLRKPKPGPLTCEVNLLKHGRTLAIGDVRITAQSQAVVSHLELTYYVGNVGQ